MFPVMRITLFTVLESAVLLSSGFAADIEWPGWRGPGRDGWVGSFQPPVPWPEKLAKSWQLDVGTGYASPVVSENRIYQHARQGDDEVVWCIDLATGTVQWQNTYAAPFTIGGGGEYHGKGPKSSPAFADGRLFTLSIAGVLSAWDAESGKLLWKRDYASQFGKGHPHWGTSTSPLVDENRVIVHFGTDDQGALIALDAATGEEIWLTGHDGASYASPILVEIQGVRQIVELNMKNVVGVDTVRGERLWQHPYPQAGTDQNMVTPAFHHGIVLVGGENRGIVALEPRRSGEVWTVRERWHQRDVALDMSSAVVNGSLLYGFSHYDKGRLFCLDIASGKVLWQGPPRTGDNVMLLAIPGHVVALINDGELRILRANGDRYEQAASYRVSESATWAPPVLWNDGILIKDTQSLIRWSVP